MTSKISDKKSKVIIIDTSGPVRQMLSETMRLALGFENVQAMSSIADVLKYLEVDTVDWIITPVMSDQPVNGLHLIKIISEFPELKNVRVSFFIEQEEHYILPSAFQLGLLSWHKKPTIKDALKEEIGGFLTELEANAFNEPITAASYLSKYLKTQKQYEDQLQLYKNLLNLFPANGNLLSEMAEPYVRLNQDVNAKRVLKQAKLVDPSLAEKVDAISKSLFHKSSEQLEGEPAPPATEGEEVSVLTVDTCVVIDSDDAVGQGVSDFIKPLGVKNCLHFNNGDDAWEHLGQHPEPQLIIMEWRIPKVSGPLLIQRIRNHGFLNVPIIILSSLLKPEDMPLIKEMGAANIVHKPLNRDLFVPAVIWTIQQDRLPTEHKAIELKIRQLLIGRKLAEAEPLKAQFLADASIPIAKKRLVEAEYAYAKGDYALARDNAVESLKHSGESVLVLNVLGKAFMRLNNFATAIKCFNKAQEVSPHNIERLCNIAEAQTDLGKKEAAAETLADAGTLDPDSKAVSDSQIKCAISSGDTETAKKLMSQLESLDSLVAYMNNKAVAFAKIGETNGAVDLYKKTINSIPEDRHETKAIVLYNLALAQVRESEIEAAISKLNQVLQLTKNKVTSKAKSLKERLEKALADGTEFKLKNSDPAPGPIAANTAPVDPAAPAATPLMSEDDYRKMMASVVATKGDLCCYLLFHPVTKADARVEPLFAKLPRFQKRDTIERKESMGADRVNKQSA